MTGRSDARSSGDTPTERAGRRTRRAAVAWVLAVVTASLVDPAVVLGGAGESAAPAGVDVFVIAHLVAYGVLAWLLVGVLAPTTRDLRAVLAAVAVAAAVGVAVELLQVPVAARSASAADALGNAVGAAVGAGLRATVGRR